MMTEIECVSGGKSNEAFLTEYKRRFLLPYLATLGSSFVLLCFLTFFVGILVLPNDPQGLRSNTMLRDLFVENSNLCHCQCSPPDSWGARVEPQCHLQSETEAELAPLSANPHCVRGIQSFVKFYDLRCGCTPDGRVDYVNCSWKIDLDKGYTLVLKILAVFHLTFAIIIFIYMAFYVSSIFNFCLPKMADYNFHSTYCMQWISNHGDSLHLALLWTFWCHALCLAFRWEPPLFKSYPLPKDFFPHSGWLVWFPVAMRLALGIYGLTVLVSLAHLPANALSLSLGGIPSNYVRGERGTSTYWKSVRKRVYIFIFLAGFTTIASMGCALNDMFGDCYSFFITIPFLFIQYYTATSEPFWFANCLPSHCYEYITGRSQAVDEAIEGQLTRVRALRGNIQANSSGLDQEELCLRQQYFPALTEIIWVEIQRQAVLPFVGVSEVEAQLCQELSTLLEYALQVRSIPILRAVIQVHQLYGVSIPEDVDQGLSDVLGDLVTETELDQMILDLDYSQNLMFDSLPSSQITLRKRFTNLFSKYTRKWRVRSYKKLHTTLAKKPQAGRFLLSRDVDFRYQFIKTIHTFLKSQAADLHTNDPFLNRVLLIFFPRKLDQLIQSTTSVHNALRNYLSVEDPSTVVAQLDTGIPEFYSRWRMTIDQNLAQKEEYEDLDKAEKLGLLAEGDKGEEERDQMVWLEKGPGLVLMCLQSQKVLFTNLAVGGSNKYYYEVKIHGHGSSLDSRYQPLSIGFAYVSDGRDHKSSYFLKSINSIFTETEDDPFVRYTREANASGTLGVALVTDEANNLAKIFYSWNGLWLRQTYLSYLFYYDQTEGATPTYFQLTNEEIPWDTKGPVETTWNNKKALYPEFCFEMESHRQVVPCIFGQCCADLLIDRASFEYSPPNSRFSPIGQVLSQLREDNQA